MNIIYMQCYRSLLTKITQTAKTALLSPMASLYLPSSSLFDLSLFQDSFEVSSYYYMKVIYGYKELEIIPGPAARQ